MKKFSIEYISESYESPITYWMPEPKTNLSSKPIFKKGYPKFCVELDNFTFNFASLNEIDHCISVLSQKNLPSAAPATGPGKHWLNRLPGFVRTWKYRQKAVKTLNEAREYFEQELEY